MVFSSGFIIILPFKDKMNIKSIKLGFISFSVYIDLFSKFSYNLAISELKGLLCESNSITDIFCLSKLNKEFIVSKSSYFFII